MRREPNINPARTRTRSRIGSVVLGALLVSCGNGVGDRGGSVGNGNNLGAVCPPATIDNTRYLRQLSLDLRGRPPTVDELERVRAAGTVPMELIDEYINSSEFLERVRYWHRAQLWPNLDGFRVRAVPIYAWNGDATTGRRGDMNRTYSPDPALVEGEPNALATVSFADGNVDRALRGGTNSVACDPTLLYPAPAAQGAAQPTYSVMGSDGVRRTYPYYDADGVPQPYHDAAHCPNYCTNITDANRADPMFRATSANYAAMNVAGAAADAHELDPSAMHCPATHPTRVINPCNAGTYDGPDRDFRERRDGYRVIRQYWTDNRDVRMCAIEAQDRVNSVATGQSCGGRLGMDPSCGCGPQGQYCMPSLGVNTGLASRAEFRLRNALNNEPLQIIASVVDRNEDYFEIFRTRRSFVTGAMSFFFRNQVTSAQGLPMTAPAPAEVLPDVNYTDPTWREYVRNSEHSGIFTTAAYLGRFATWRSRISQFRTAFMCRPFYGGGGSLPASDDACTREPNLARRCGCQNCHSALEPMGAWFGRWAERSAQFLPADMFPSFDPNCQTCALTGQGCTDRCRTHYVIDTLDADGARYAGTLRGYLYRSDEEAQRIEEGPRGLVEYALSTGELQSCAVRTAWNNLLGRQMNESEMRTALPEMVGQFNANGHRYRDLVRAIVTSPAYRRVD